MCDLFYNNHKIVNYVEFFHFLIFPFFSLVLQSKEIDAELIERQNELNRVIANREAYIARLIKKNQTHNGDS